MLDTTNFLIHKLSLQIFRPMQFEDNTTVFDAVKYILLERICETFHLQIEWDTFSRGGKFRSASGAANIQIASLSSDIRTLWAIRIQVRDANMVKRQWSYQIGIRVFDGEHLQLCYAKCCYDHTAGSIQTPRPIPMVLECVSKFILTEIMQVIYECRQGKQSPGTCVPACRSEWRRDETL